MTKNKSDNTNQRFIISNLSKTIQLNTPQRDDIEKRGLTIPLPDPQQGQNTQTDPNSSHTSDKLIRPITFCLLHCSECVSMFGFSHLHPSVFGQIITRNS